MDETAAPPPDDAAEDAPAAADPGRADAVPAEAEAEAATPDAAPVAPAPAQAEEPEAAPAEPASDTPAGDAAAGPSPEAAAQAAAADLAARLEAATRRADELAALGARQQAMLDRLHADVQTLRRGELVEASAPLVRDVARVADDVHRLGGDDGPEPGSDLALVLDQLLGVLDRAGVVLVQPSAGEPFDPRRHNAVGAVPTGDPALDRTVASVRRPGLVRDAEHVLRPADVEVHRHRPGPDADAGPSPEPPTDEEA